MASDDLFGHIPRKKKDPSTSVSIGGSSLSNRAETQSARPSTDVISIPRKRQINASGLSNSSTGSAGERSFRSDTNTSDAPRKKTNNEHKSLQQIQQSHSSIEGSRKQSVNTLVSSDQNERPTTWKEAKRQMRISKQQQSDKDDTLRSNSSPSRSPSPRDVPIATSRARSSPTPTNQKILNADVGTTVERIDDDNNLRFVSNERFRVISDNPLVFKIKVHDINMTPVGSATSKSSGSNITGRNRSVRQVVTASKGIAIAPDTPIDTAEGKRKRSSIYQELEDTDSEDFMTPEEELEIENRRNRKRIKKKGNKKDGSDAGSGTEETSTIDVDAARYLDPMIPNENNLTIIPVDGSCPPGEISSLWYSQEKFLDLFVLEKVIGWKTRQKITLYETIDFVNDGSKTETAIPDMSEAQPRKSPGVLDGNDAVILQQAILSNSEFFAEPKLRMEVSRINPSHCPVVFTYAETLVSDLSLQREANLMWNVEGRKYRVQVEAEREEVLLIKWRGRSYIHCSWERASDVQRLDPSPNFTARSKIKKYYQAQETTLGLRWRVAIEEDRKSVLALHGQVPTEPEKDADSVPVDEYFSSQSLEVERILGCDESTMNLNVFSSQRAVNIAEEQERLKKKEQTYQIKSEEGGDTVESCPVNTYRPIIQILFSRKESPWDPEDNVRYVVKWKGLQYSDMTWEYWRHIKHDAVNEAEDFWYRQKAPDLEVATKQAQKVHPHIRDFKKLTESRPYGISKRPRLVAKLGKDESPVDAEEEEEAEQDSGFKLRSYQLEGVNWLLFNWWNKRSCILADEMGLGKTIQSAAFLQELQLQPTAEVRGPFLIVAPLSLVSQWQSELASWAPDMNVILYHGSADAREFLVREEFYFTEQFCTKTVAQKLRRLHVTKFHVLITTYEVVLKDIVVLSKIKWKALLVDEAHRLKNASSKLFEELALVPREYCVLLTGTPIANATEELWALLHFSNPAVFADKSDFLTKFGEMTDAKQVGELHTLLKPYLLRRVKEDVEKSLPPKEETVLEVSLTPIQKTFYKAIYERNTSFLFKGARVNNTPSLMNVMMELRKCCNHPFLIQGAEERILNEAAAKLKAKGEEDGKPAMLDYYQIFTDQLVKSSGKMVLMEKLLEKLFVDGQKVLIFSQMVRVLDILEELLKFKKYRYERLDGSTSSSLRLHAVERFKKPSLQRFVMLLSTRAGGLGLNLTAASVVIIFDSDWNPQNDLQAMARAHRIGQTKAVRVYRFLTAKTYEMHMFHSASMKLGLERAVLSQNREKGDSSEDNKGKRRSDKEAQAKEIDELLKKGAYDVFRDDDEDGEKFMETDIDQLLAQSSKKVTYDAAASGSSSGLGSFSKASFVANTDDGAKDVDLDDPDFWSKAIGLEAPTEIPEDIAAMLDDGVKRNRKQVQVYDPYAETAEAELKKKEREKQLEKEEKERQLAEKKKQSNSKKKKKNREENQNGTEKDKDEKKLNLSPQTSSVDDAVDKTREIDLKSRKNKKKFDRIRAMKRAENEDPLMERIKQAWEVPHRNRATAAIIRFGFGRFCKIRSESNLLGLPLQDLESFASAYIYHLSLQLSVSLMAMLQQTNDLSNIRSSIREWIGTECEREVEWLCESLQSTVKAQIEVESYRRYLRMPLVLAERAYIDDLRHGCAFRALRRICCLNRLNTIIEDELESILARLGHEELGKRGCEVSDLNSLDADLKARFVTTEELLLSVGAHFQRIDRIPPASWWDRSCDVALFVGTFVHGLGNYEAMRKDATLPFGECIKKANQKHIACKLAMQNFGIATNTVRRVFESALNNAKTKAEQEVQAAVAAAAKTASKREEDAALIRKGGFDAEFAARNMLQIQVDNAFEFDGTDSHFVTLTRIHDGMQDSLLKLASPSHMVIDQSQDDQGGELQDDTTSSMGRIKEHHSLPMPDSRVLDQRLLRVLEVIEANVYGDEIQPEIPQPTKWEKSSTVQENLVIRNTISMFFEGTSACNEYSGVGLSGNQCGTAHRSLNDGSDFGFGAASSQLFQIANGTDAQRYLRAVAVPMNLSRFAILGLAYAEASCVKELLGTENFRYYGSRDHNSNMRLKKSVKCDNSAVVTGDGIESVKSPEVIECSITSDPITLIPQPFRDNAKLRAVVCMVLLYYGCPNEIERGPMNASLWRSCLNESAVADDIAPPTLFDGEMLRTLVCSCLPPDATVPSWKQLSQYIDKILMPHCLRLCMEGNGPSTRTARGSHGEYETALGVSVYPEIAQDHPTPIPDPCLALNEHSLEALAYAAAILRRVRLLRSCQYLCSGNNNINVEVVHAASRSIVMRQLSDMPVWWCPWIHDVGLLMQAASGGLFSIVRHRNDNVILSSHAIQQFLYTSFVADNEHALPAARQTPPDQVTEWTERQAAKFPSVNEIERRLAIFCAEATSDLQHSTDDSPDTGDVLTGVRFHNLPMLDHGGWPRH